MQNKFQNLSNLHQTLYQKALEEAKSYLNVKSKELALYSDRFNNWIPKNFKPTERSNLHKACVDSDYILFGDFHTLRQSQRALSRLLYQIANYYPSRGICLALECFQSHHQKYLDDYMQGTITEHQFLTTIDYDSVWGFPWPNYKRLLTTCSNLKIKVFCINSKHRDNSLKKRDDHAAKILEQIRKNYPSHSIFTLIGENHLADEHLPKSILSLNKDKTAPKTLRILTNIDAYYFALRDNQKTHGSEYLELDQSTFCIINTPPWIKWKSFTMWEEMQGIVDTIDYTDIDYDEIDDEGDLYTEITYDLDSSFINVANELLKFLSIPMTKSLGRKIENFRAVFLNDLEEFISSRQISFDHVTEREIFEKCEKDGVVYIPDKSLVIIAELNANHIAEAAGQHIFCIFNPQKTSFKEKEQIIYASLQHAFGLFTAKIFNPKRGFMILDNYENFLRLNKRKKLKGRAKEKRILSKAILQFTNLIEANGIDNFQFPGSLILTERVTFGGLGRAIGQIIGYNLFCHALEHSVTEFDNDLNLKSNATTPSEIRQLFSRLWDLNPTAHSLKKTS